MSAGCAAARERAAAPTLGVFERHPTAWVFACIVAGIALGLRLRAPFELLGQIEVAQINLPVAVLGWLMIVPMLPKVDLHGAARLGLRVEPSV